MAFAPGWRRRAAARSSPPVVLMAASACRLDVASRPSCGIRAGMIGRLTKRPDFLAAASGRRFHTERMTVQGRLRGAGAHSDALGLRFGLTVTKKVGNAPERSRIKRRLRAAVQVAAAGHAATDMDVVVIGRRDI